MSLGPFKKSGIIDEIDLKIYHLDQGGAIIDKFSKILKIDSQNTTFVEEINIDGQCFYLIKFLKDRSIQHMNPELSGDFKFKIKASGNIQFYFWLNVMSIKELY